MNYVKAVVAYSCEICGGDEDRRCTCPPEPIWTNENCGICKKDLAICRCSENDKSAHEYYEALSEAQWESDYGYHDENED
jgi:hypothetical protein